MKKKRARDKTFERTAEDILLSKHTGKIFLSFTSWKVVLKEQFPRVGMQTGYTQIFFIR